LAKSYYIYISYRYSFNQIHYEMIIQYQVVGSTKSKFVSQRNVKLEERKYLALGALSMELRKVLDF